MTKTICIIGAGTAGLCAARHALSNNMEVTVYEQTKELGGTWVFSNVTGKDEFGIDVHTSMYKGLRTNLPKEVMGFPDYPMPPQEKSYIPGEDVLSFLHTYADTFHLRKHIRFSHHVLRVMPKNGCWEVIVKDLPNETVLTAMFDFILICNGHYNTPVYANLKGSETFSGKIIHSHDYRDPVLYKGEKVLVIGGGASGLDISNMLSKYAKTVYLSHHSRVAANTTFAENVIHKPDVVQITKNEVEFSDNSTESVTVILHCTGYKYTFPFLSVECRISVDDNYVAPLYKHCININMPSMAFIGLPFVLCLSQMMDLQVRFVMQYFTGNRHLPSKEDMMADTDAEMNSRWQRGYLKRQAHFMGQDQEKYFKDLSEEAGIENLKPVMIKLFNHTICFLKNYNTYRDDVFRLIDDETFGQVQEDGSILPVVYDTSKPLPILKGSSGLS